MKTRHALALSLLILVPSTAYANPVEFTCGLLSAIGGNNPDAVAPALEVMTSRWSEENRSTAVNRMETLAAGGVFAGGNVYRIAALGEDLEEHIVILRLKAGEVSGLRLRYEWTPDGSRLVSFEAKRQFNELMAAPAMQPPEPISCP